MKKILIALTILFITSCAQDPISIHRSNNINIKIELLFEYENIKMYRFYDNGQYHYFTKNITITTQNCGKNCTYQEIIKT